MFFIANAIECKPTIWSPQINPNNSMFPRTKHADMSHKELITEMPKKHTTVTEDEMIAGLDLWEASHKWNLPAEEVHQILWSLFIASPWVVKSLGMSLPPQYQCQYFKAVLKYLELSWILSYGVLVVQGYCTQRVALLTDCLCGFDITRVLSTTDLKLLQFHFWEPYVLTLMPWLL